MQSRFGAGLLCGGEFVVTIPGSPPRQPTAPVPAATTHPTPQARAASSATPTPPRLNPYVANGPAGPCIALGPATGTANVTVSIWIAAQRLGPCPVVTAAPGAVAAPLPPLDPATLAVQFWQTIPLPVPHPSIPPGYAITGKLAYLVTDGTLTPAHYQRATPLGPLTITARGSYFVDWGDGTLPTWTGPYRQEGGPYPGGQVFHTYDFTGTVNVTVREVWTATWALGPAHGALSTLHTTGTVPGFPVRQLQAVITN